MNHCSYTRCLEKGVFEYGHITIEDSATKKEKRTYVPLGTKATIDEALKANSMALEGMPRLGKTFTAPFSWSDLYDPKRDPLSEQYL